MHLKYCKTEEFQAMASEFIQNTKHPQLFPFISCLRSIHCTWNIILVMVTYGSIITDAHRNMDSATRRSLEMEQFYSPYLLEKQHRAGAKREFYCIIQTYVSFYSSFFSTHF